MTFLLWASFIVCAIVGIPAMAIFAMWLWTKAIDWWLDVKLIRKAVHDTLWRLAQEEHRLGARRREASAKREAERQYQEAA